MNRSKVLKTFSSYINNFSSVHDKKLKASEKDQETEAQMS